MCVCGCGGGGGGLNAYMWFTDRRGECTECIKLGARSFAVDHLRHHLVTESIRCGPGRHEGLHALVRLNSQRVCVCVSERTCDRERERERESARERERERTRRDDGGGGAGIERRSGRNSEKETERMGKKGEGQIENERNRRLRIDVRNSNTHVSAQTTIGNLPCAAPSHCRRKPLLWLIVSRLS